MVIPVISLENITTIYQPTKSTKSYIAQVLQAQLQSGLLLIIIHIARVIAGIAQHFSETFKFLSELMFVLHGN